MAADAALLAQAPAQLLPSSVPVSTPSWTLTWLVQGPGLHAWCMNAVPRRASATANMGALVGQGKAAVVRAKQRLRQAGAGLEALRDGGLMRRRFPAPCSLFNKVMVCTSGDQRRYGPMRKSWAA